MSVGDSSRQGALDLSADRVVIWTPDTGNSIDGSGGVIEQVGINRLQIYLEGNILVRQERNTVTATHAFYDAGNDRALLLNAELRAYLPPNGRDVSCSCRTFTAAFPPTFSRPERVEYNQSVRKTGVSSAGVRYLCRTRSRVSIHEVGSEHGDAGWRTSVMGHVDEFAVHPG